MEIRKIGVVKKQQQQQLPGKYEVGFLEMFMFIIGSGKMPKLVPETPHFYIVQSVYGELNDQGNFHQGINIVFTSIKTSSFNGRLVS